MRADSGYASVTLKCKMRETTECNRPLPKLAPGFVRLRAIRAPIRWRTCLMLTTDRRRKLDDHNDRVAIRSIETETPKLLLETLDTVVDGAI